MSFTEKSFREGSFSLFFFICLVSISVFVITSCATTVSKEELAVEFYNLGNAYFDMGNYERAIVYFKKANKYDSTLESANYNLSLAYIKTGNSEEAVKLLTDLLRRDPENLKVLKALAYAYHVNGNNEKAIVTLDSILELAPEDIDTLNNKGIILWGIKNYSGAEECFKKILEYSPENTDAKFNLGKLLLEAGRADEGIAFLEEYAQAKPDDYEVFLLLGFAYEKEERYEKSLESFTLALSIKDDISAAWFESAKILLTKVEDPDKGIVHLKQALKLGFDNKEKLKALLQSEDLLEREKVQGLIEERGIKLNLSDKKSAKEGTSGNYSH